MNIQNIKNTIYDWLYSIVPTVPIIWAYESATQPSPTYITINMTILPTKIGRDEIRRISNSYHINGLRKIMLSINAYGHNAIQVLSDIQSTLDNPSKSNVLSAGGLSISDSEDIRDLTTRLNTVWERRGLLEVRLYAAEDVSTDITTIDTVEITSNINGITTTKEVDIT